jgi:chemosensory pili system protein ChpA (sensor histidine kinase/response regulator)
MSTSTKVDPSTLGWVKTEIDDTLKQARLELEAFAENPADKTRLRFCITHLHQVVGTLLMVELDGAALLARETEALADAILNNKAQPDSAVLETLTRAMLTLPDYLSRLQFGQPDVVLRNVPLVNEMRTARGVEPLAEAELFAPDLSVRPPRAAAAHAKLSDDEYRDLARQLRPAYQSALLHWLRDAANDEALQQIGATFDELQTQTGLVPAEQLFWVAGGFVEALRDGGVEPTPERKKFLARVDQYTKKLIDGAERGALRKAAEPMIKGMLLEVGKAQSRGERVTQLKQAFELEQLLGLGVPVPALETAELPTPEVLQSVSQVLSKELEQAQDLLSAYFEPQQKDGSVLAPLGEILHKMSGTLEMVGVPLLKQLIDEIAAVARALQEGRLAHADAASMPMAQALLLVENSARDVVHSAGGWRAQIENGIQRLRGLLSPQARPATDGIEVGDAQLSEAEFRQLLGVVSGEVGANISKIEEALEAFAADTGKLAQLEEVSGLLSQIQGALQILGQERAARLLEATHKYVEDLRGGHLAPDSAVLDGLAVSIGTIGAYVEGLHSGRRNLEALLESAEREMRAAMRGAQGAADPAVLVAEAEQAYATWRADPSDATADVLRRALQSLGSAADAQGHAKIERIATEMERALAHVAQDPTQLSDAVRNTLAQSMTALGALVKRQLAPTVAEPAPVKAPPPPAPKSTPAPAAGEGDEEIMQIFIEDARDVLKNIVREFAVWRANPDNQNALTELRRGYHTIKGSGRMVGAGEIAEFGWAIENMLNKYRDGKIPLSDAMIDLLDRAQAAIPQLVDQLEGGPAPTIDYAALREKAHALAQGATEAPAVSAPTTAAPAPATSPEPALPGLPRLDGVLLEIFTNEARGHVGTLRAEIAACREAGEVRLVPDTLGRAVHTLLGNARSLGIAMMAAACLEAEKLLNALRAQQEPLHSSHIDLLMRLADTVEDMIGALNGQSGVATTVPQRFDAIGREAHAEYQRLMEAGVAAPSAAPAVEEIVAPRPPVAPKASVVPLPVARATSAAARPAAVETVVERVDPELLEIFHEEALDLLSAIDGALALWRAAPDDLRQVQELKRLLHTLKGGARMAGAATVGTLAHNTESLLKNVEDRTLGASPELLDVLVEVHDTLAHMIEKLNAGEPLLVPRSLNARVDALIKGESASAPSLVRGPRLGPIGEPLASAEPPAAPSVAPEVEMPPMVARPSAGKLFAVPELQVEPAPSSISDSASPLPTFEVGEDTPASVPFETAHFDTPAPAVAPFLEPSEPTAAAAPTAGREAAEGAVEFGDLHDRREGDEETGKLWPERAERRGQIRVNTQLLNNLVNYAGEVSIARSRMEQQVYGFRDNLAELARNITRFREQIRELEIQSESQILYRLENESPDNVKGLDFDPLEFDRFSRLQQLSRQLAESLHDLTTIQGSLGNFIGEAEAVLQQQARINTELQEGLMRTRMVSFATQAGRLRHMLRQTARELGKSAELDLEGADVELDRTVLERMIGPFEHMIRNSLDHGIEPEAERQRAGKPETGRVTIASAQQGSEIVIRFSDDGAGLNLPAISKKAIERGLLAPSATVTDDELVQYILRAGFSTAEKVTEVSGRGVGMDVVYSEVKQLGGSMSVDTRRGQGTTFIIRLPLTLSIAQALMVYVGNQLFAVPLASVANIIEYPVEHLNELAVGKNPLLKHGEYVYPYMHLGMRFGMASTPRNNRKVPVLIARTGTREIAIQVDALSGTREIVIKALSPQLAELKGLAGATILGDGRVVLIIDVAGLWYRDDAIHLEERAVAAEPVKPARERPVIMVVDDSLTVRKVTSKHLQKRGMDVLVAKDGLDAVEQLRDHVPDLMLVDIEMPRMDGYELTTRVRGDARLKHIPIIMITSRAGGKHRQKAFELGVDQYMSKPYQEEELFNNIDTLLAQGRTS